MCNATLKDRKHSQEQRERLGLNSIRNCIRKGRLRWFGRVQRCSDDSLVKKCRDTVVEGQQTKGRPQKMWYQVVDSDLRSLKIDRDLAQNQTEWKMAMKKPIYPMQAWKIDV